jgi:hypothetical protein
VEVQGLHLTAQLDQQIQAVAVAVAAIRETFLVVPVAPE